MLPNGSFVSGTSLYVEPVWPVDPFVVSLVARVNTGQATQCQQPRHEAQFGVRFAGPYKLINLVEESVVVARLRRHQRERRF